MDCKGGTAQGQWGIEVLSLLLLSEHFGNYSSSSGDPMQRLD